MTRINLQFKMLSDWRIGSGKGQQGALDDLVQRDAEGFPYIPTSTLRGIIRDSAEQLAYALDGGQKGGIWFGLVDCLFGSQPNLIRAGDPVLRPIASRVMLSPGRLSAAVRQQLSGSNRAPLRELLTFAKAGVAIDHKTGTASENMLRFLEMSRKGMVLEAAMDFDLEDLKVPSEEIDAAMAFLKCAAALVTSLGGDRRRGAGKCEVSIDGNPDIAKKAAEKLSGCAAPAKLVECLEDYTDRSSSASLPGISQVAQFKRLKLNIKLDSPTIIGRDVIGNTVSTRDYLPGTMLLGPVKKLLRDAGLASADLDDAILGGRLRVLPAYLEISGKRSMPVPFSWATLKDDASAAGKAAIVNKLDVKPETQTKGMKSGYFVRGDTGYPLVDRPSVSVFTHNTVDDVYQSPSSEVGGVYVYEALTDGQMFCSELWIDPALIEHISIVTTATAKAAIGRATAAGYGQIGISLGCDLATSDETGDADSNVLYFESDCILPEGAGPVALLEGISGQEMSDDEQFIRYIRLDGWNVRRGLPKTSSIAIAAGSVVRFKETVGSDKMNQMTEVFAGTRAAEGFGRIHFGAKAVVNPIDASKAEAENNVGSEEQKNSTDFDAAGDPLLEEVLAQYIRKLIAREAEAKTEANDGNDLAKALFGQNLSKVNMSTIGSIRSVMGQLETDIRLKNLTRYLESRAEDKGEPYITMHSACDSNAILGKLEVKSQAEIALGEKVAASKLGAADMKRHALLCAFHAVARATKRGKEDGAKDIGEPEPANGKIGEDA